MKTCQAISLGPGGYVLDGTIKIEDAGVITYTATPGNEAYMAELVAGPIPTIQRGQHRLLTSSENPQEWFDMLPVQYHGSFARVIPLGPGEKAGQVRHYKARGESEDTA
jgi:hypothetical protein